MASRPTQLLDHQQKARAVLEAPVAEPLQEGRWPLILESLALQPIHMGLPAISETLIERHQHIYQLSAQYALPTRFCGYSLTFSTPHVHRRQHSDWAIMPLQRDPSYQARNEKLIMPAQVVADLWAMYHTGCDFDAIFVAHEIPKNSVADGQTPSLDLLLPPPSAQTLHHLQKLEAVNIAFWRAVRGGVKALALGAVMTPLIVGGAMVAAGGAAAAVMGAASLDPIVFGVNVDTSTATNGQYPSMWYYLTHWYWPTAETR